ncbi:MAG: hypothetical protein RLZZ142_2805 [Verrucomicrobiota bacterium]
MSTEANSEGAAGSAGETMLWTGHPSQWVYVRFYALCVLLGGGALGAAPFTGGLSLAGLVLPAGMWAVRWWMTKCMLYELTSQRLRVSQGLLNRRSDELELFRVKDYTLEQPFLLRVVGLGNLRLLSSDSSTPVVELRAIPGVAEVREKLRTAVQSERDRKRVREMDVDRLDETGGVGLAG